MYGVFFWKRQRIALESSRPFALPGRTATAPDSPTYNELAAFHSAATMYRSLLASIQPKCSPYSLSSRNSASDRRPSLSLSYCDSVVANAGSAGVLLPSVETSSESPDTSGVPNASPDPTGTHHREAPVVRS